MSNIIFGMLRFANLKRFFCGSILSRILSVPIHNYNVTNVTIIIDSHHRTSELPIRDSVSLNESVCCVTSRMPELRVVTSILL